MVVSGTVSGDLVERLAIRVGRGQRAKEMMRGDQVVGAADYIGAIRPIAFTAESRGLVAGAPELRRAFLDRGVATGRTEYLVELAAYRRALRQKGILLARGAARAEIEAWNAELARRGGAITAERAAWADTLKKNYRRWPGESSTRKRRSKSSIGHRPPRSLEPSVVPSASSGSGTPSKRGSRASSAHTGHSSAHNVTTSTSGSTGVSPAPMHRLASNVASRSCSSWPLWRCSGQDEVGRA